MSMLAERKRKVKWSLNPRGKAWSQDSNKFGQKILEKMGWEQGKGLGRDGQGITEHIRTTYKNDNKGMGYKDSNDQWTEHEDNFASLLESLSGEAAKLDEVKLKSLEKKSETAKSRVHYHKFTRGKDLSRYSEKDLANIFGKKTLKESKRDKQEEKSDTNGDVHKYDSDLLVNAGSMRDYFKKKLPNFGKTNGYVVGRNGVLTKEESESESEVRPSFGFGYKSNGITSDENTLKNLSANGDGKNKSEETAKATFVSYLDVEETDSNKNNKKKRKGKECDEHSVLSPKKKSKKDDETTPTTNNVLEVERKKKKKQKKAKNEGGIDNPALHLDTSQPESEEVVLDEIDESDIMLNVATTPIVTKSTPRNEGNAYSITKVTSVKRTKSVRFSDVTQERIIPNNDGLREIEVESETFSPQVTNGYSENHSNGIDTSPLSYDENRRKSGKKRKLGLDNAAFDKQKNTLEENLDSISKTIDTYQAEIENDINEKKLETFQMDDIMVGEVGNPHGKNEKLPDGSMLRFKYAHFKAQTPFYLQNKTGPKKSYKHLIKGDIVVKFKNSNLHEINGYASRT